MSKLYISIFGDGSHIWRFMDLSDTIKENEPMHIEPSLAKYAWPCGVRDVKGIVVKFTCRQKLWQYLCTGTDKD